MLTVNHLIGFGGKRAAGGGVTWTPASDANTYIWYKGSSNTGANNDPITTWTDSSGNGLDGTAGSGILLDTGGLNGLNIVNSPGASSPAMNVPTNSFVSVTEGAIYAVVKVNNDPPVGTNVGGWSMFGSADFTSGGNHYPFSDSNVYDGFGSTVRKSTGNPTASLAAWHIVSMHSKSASYQMWVNGNDGSTPHFSTGTNTVGWRATPLLFHGQLTTYFDGRIAEIVVMNNFGDTTSRQKMEGYLAHRFAITSVLDAGHPYKSTPPAP